MRPRVLIVVTALLMTIGAAQATAATAPETPDAPPALVAAGPTWIEVTWPQVSDATGYRVWYGTNANGTKASLVTASANLVQITGLSPGTVYYVDVAATNSAGTSVYTAKRAVKTGTQEGVFPDQPPATPVEAPQLVAAGTSWVEVEWPAVNEATSYRLWYSNNASGKSAKLVTTTATSARITGLSNNTAYHVDVAAVNAEGTSAYTSRSPVRTGPPATPATAPTLVAVGPTWVEVQWPSVPGADHYRVWHSNNASGTGAKLVTSTTTSVRIAGLMPLTTYYVDVAAANTAGWSAYTSRRAVATTASEPEPDACLGPDHASNATLTFSDEFTGTAVDTTKWKVRDRTYLDFDAAYILKENVTVQGGHLTIHGRRVSTPYTVTQGRTQRWHTTGYIDTIGKFSQRYGRWEMRAKLPVNDTDTRGVWPAFWLRGDNVWGEIDVMETWGGPHTAPQSRSAAAAHLWTIWRDTMKVIGPERVDGWAAEHVPAGQEVWQDWHVFGFNWAPGCLEFTLDDEVVGTVDPADHPWMATALDGNFNIRLNMQIGSDYWGWPTAEHTSDHQEYKVDYVRVYGLD